jgi:hypothetical protein
MGGQRLMRSWLEAAPGSQSPVPGHGKRGTANGELGTAAGRPEWALMGGGRRASIAGVISLAIGPRRP